MGKRSKFNRILSFVLSLSLAGSDMLPAFAAGEEDVRIIAAEEASGEESVSEDEAGESESVPADETAEVSGNEAADEEPSDGEGITDPDTDGSKLSADGIAIEEDPVVDEGLIDFEFVPGYVEMPDSEGLSVVADGISFRQIQTMLVDDESDGEYADDYAAKTDSAYPYKYTETGSILEYLNGFPVPRNQNPYGSCWAHSAVGLAEFYLIRHGMADKTVDFSELHLVNYCYVQGTPSIAGDTGDKVYFTPTGSNPNILDAGGNLNYAAQTLLHQRGYAAESDVPYSQAATVIASGIDPSLERKDVAYLKNAMEISMSNTDLIKQCIIENGIVGVSICASNSYYSSTYNSFYCYNTPATNHAVDLVGWDDDYPASRFVTTAPGNGAWLVRNSWNYYGDTRLHYYTYFWISYYDQSLTEKNGSYEKSAWTYEMMDADEFPGNSYYYDSEIHNSGSLSYGSGNCYSANIFKVSGGADKETIEAVTFSVGNLASSGTGYEIMIYTGVDPSQGPSSGTLQSSATTTGTLTLTGMYTIDLKAPVTVNKGDYFSVVIKRNDARTVNYEAGYSGSNGVSYTVKAQSGQSFYSPNGSYWYDVTTNNYGGNLVIGAQTSDKTEDKSSITLSPASLTLTTASPVADLTATVKKADGTVDDSPTISWSSSDTGVATVVNGKVTAVANGTADITASANGKTAKCTVTVSLTKAAAPSADKSDGSELEIDSTIAVSCATAGAVIYYTLDGTVPTRSSGVVTGPITIGSAYAGKNITLKLRAYADYYEASDVAVYNYTVESRAGIELSDASLVLTTASPVAVLNATVKKADGTADDSPTISWSSSDTGVATVVNGMVTAVSSGTAIITAAANGKTAECTVEVKLTKVATPSANKVDGSELGIDSSITVSCTTGAAAVYYTLDGTVPTKSSTKVTGPITIGSQYAGENITLKLRAFADYYEASDVATYNYTVESRAGIELSDASLVLTTASPVAVLNATVKKADGTADDLAEVSWTSSLETVATVDAGTITAVSDGTAVITAQSGDLTATCSVTVSLSKVSAPVADKADNSTLFTGDTITVTCATAAAKVYYTLDGSTPTGSSNLLSGGKITIGTDIATGSLTVKLRAFADHYNASDVVTLTYTVENRSGISLNSPTLTLTTADPVALLTATVTKVNGDIDNSAVVSWTSSDPSVATVTNGTVTAVSSGTVQITAMSGSNTAICTVTVELSKVAKPSADVASGNVSLGTVITVSCATEGASTYYTLDGSVPTVSSAMVTGPITIGPEYAGESVTVKFRSFAEYYMASEVATYTYIVESKAGIVLNVHSLELTSAYPEETLTATVTKADGTVAGDAAVIWTSSNPSVVKVDNGLVTAVAGGQVVITAKSGIYTDSCNVTVIISKAAKPTADKAGGTEISLDSRTVNVSSETAGAVLYYTLNGSDPTKSSAVTTGAITIPVSYAGKSVTVKVRAYADHYDPSDIAEFNYTVESRAGIVLSDTELELTTLNPTAALTARVFNADGTEKSTAAVSWASSDASVASVTGGKITAVANGSAVITAKSSDLTATCAVTVSLSKVKKPTADKADGTELTLESRTVRVSTATAGAALYYTLNGSEPTTGSTATSGDITIPLSYAGKSVTVKVRAYAEYHEPSDIAEFTYTVESKAAVQLSESSVSLSTGSPSKTLSAAVYAADGSIRSGAVVEWSSSDSTVASVDNGKITALKSGSAVITASCEGLSASCTVTVSFTKVSTPVCDKESGTGVIINSVIRVSTATAGAKLYYTTDGSDPTVTSALTDGKISIDPEYLGSVMTIRVRAYAEYHDPSDIAEFIFTVEDMARLELSAGSLELTSAAPYATLTAKVYTAEGSPDKDAAVVWSSSDTAVATVNGGKITAVSEGTAVITAKSGIHTAACSVKVLMSAASKPVSDHESGLQLALNTSVEVSCDIPGAKIYYTLDGSNPDESSLQTAGRISFGKEYAAQSVTLKLRAYAAHYQASEIAVYEYSFEDRSSVVLSTPELCFTGAAESATLTATVFDAAGDIDTAASVTWTSSDAAVATVDNGVVTAVADGEAVITAKSGIHTAECSVKVTIVSSPKKQVPYTVSITPSEVKFKASGEVVKLAVTVKDKTGMVINTPVLTFKSSNELVATVDDKGIITAGSPGEARITVKCGSRTAICNVSVEIARQEIAEEETYYTLSFYANGSLYSNVQVLKGTTIGDKMPADPAGQFTCWIDSETSEVWNSSSPVYKDHILEADFEEERRSAYDPIPDLQKIDLYLVKGQKVQLDPNIKWVLDKQYNTILGLTKKGMLTAKNAGKAVVVSDPAGTEYTVYVVTPVITNKRMTLIAGESGEFELDLGGRDEGYEVAWTSSAPMVATVNGGKVYAIAKGNATITATVNGKAYNCSVKVNETDSKVAVNETTTAITLSPLQSVNTKLKGVWTSDIGMYKYGKNAKKPDYSDGVVYISAAGKMTAIGSGTTTVKVTTDKGEVRSFKVTVNKPVEQVQYLAIGKSRGLKFTNVKAASAIWTERNIESLSGDKVVSVNQKNGAVKALSPGIAEVSCTYTAYPSVPGSGFTYITRVYVEEPALEETGGLVKANANGTVYKLENIDAGSAVALKFVKDAGHAVYQPVVYKSSKPEVAYADERGIIHAKGKGKAKITFKINGRTYSINVVVK